MARNGMMGLMNVNRSLTNLGDESRQLRLPTMNPFPKLERPAVRQGAGKLPAPNPARTGAALIDRRSVALPEMTTDVIDVAAGYSVENVKREQVARWPWSRLGLEHLVERMLGQDHRAARL